MPLIVARQRKTPRRRAHGASSAHTAGWLAVHPCAGRPPKRDLRLCEHRDQRSLGGTRLLYLMRGAAYTAPCITLTSLLGGLGQILDDVGVDLDPRPHRRGHEDL